MRAWLQLGCVLLALLVSTGCAKGPAVPDASANRGGPRRVKAARGTPQTLPAAKAIYTAGGKLGAGWLSAVAVQPGAGQRYLVLVEWVASKKDPSLGRYRLVRLDLLSGRAQPLADLEEGEVGSKEIACARNGRVAVREERPRDWDDECRIRVREPGGRWRPVSDWSEDLQTPIAWSPDSSSLLLSRFRSGGSWPIVYAVAAAPNAQTPFAETPLSRRPLQQAAWSADGSRLFATALRNAPGLTVDLISIEWPSRGEQALFTSPEADLQVAEESGTVVVSVMGADQRDHVWKVELGSKPEPTPALLPSVPMEAAVSPDGRALAAVLGKEVGRGDKAHIVSEGGLVIYDLVTGAEGHVPDAVGKNITAVHWVLGGRALIFTIAIKGVASYDPKGMGRQLWMVEVEPRRRGSDGR